MGVWLRSMEEEEEERGTDGSGGGGSRGMRSWQKRHSQGSARLKDGPRRTCTPAEEERHVVAEVEVAVAVAVADADDDDQEKGE